MPINDLVPFDDPKDGFEALARENGNTTWYASDLAKMLGYSDRKKFIQKAVQKAMSVCVSLEISIPENFREESRVVDGEPIQDFRLTRFGCYLSAMNADVTKPMVAKAQAYFITLAETFRQYIQNAENVQRVPVRSEISDHEKSLSLTAERAGVEDYALFRNAGYRGLYNKNLNELKAYKGYQGERTLYDFMGGRELAANLFRITETEAKIQKDGVHGQKGLESTAFHVGRKVRETMKELSGDLPENLPLVEDIRKVKSGIKKTRKEFEKMDRKSLPKTKKK